MDGTEQARRLIADEREKKTGFLDLGNLQLTELPIKLFELNHLRSLNLGLYYVDELGEGHKAANGGWRGIWWTSCSHATSSAKPQRVSPRC